MTLNYKELSRKGSAFSMMLLIALVSCSSSGKEAVADETLSEGTAAGWKITVRGKITNPQAGKVMIQELRQDGQGKQDTVTVKADGSFVKYMALSEPGYYRLNFYNRQVVDLILNRDNLDIVADGNDPRGYFEIKGSTDIDLIREVQNTLGEMNTLPEVARINQEFGEASQVKNQKRMSELQGEYMALMKTYHDRVAARLEEKSPSIAVINLLQSNIIDRDQYFSTYVAVADKLKKEWPDYSLSKEFVTQVENMKRLAIGQQAPEISLPGPDGKVISLSSMKGKYVLVDFWAKWCGPCRQENPNVVRAFNKYKDKGFTVFGVSLDRNKEDWIKAIADDGLTWTHVSDLKYFQSEAAKTYNISAIPFSILLDPKGIIIAKNLRGAALEKKLEEVLGGK